jgi:hypothetical protein
LTIGRGIWGFSIFSCFSSKDGLICIKSANSARSFEGNYTLRLPEIGLLKKLLGPLLAFTKGVLGLRLDGLSSFSLSCLLTII